MTIESLQGVSQTIDDDVAEPGPVPVVITRNGDRSEQGDPLTYRQAREAPCLSCTASPCCNYLQLADFQLESLLDVDYAVYLLNFEGIIVGLGRDLKIDVYLHQACGYLDVPSGLCTVHSTPIQPAVCVHYKSHSCSYRHRMTVEVDPVRPLLDRHRMAWLAERMVFDDDRQVIGAPPWDEMLQAFHSMPMERRPAPAPKPDPVVEEWRSIVLAEKPSADGPTLRRYDDAEVSDPCQGCGAWCCQLLVFDRGVPKEASQLEFLRYCLGFPGVEVGVSSEGWAVVVHTTCRHLEGNRCSVFGTDERPLRCGYYDALNCKYRVHFGVPRPDEVVRVSREQFGIVADSILFDDLGRIVAIPPVEVLRNRLEEAERARATSERQVAPAGAQAVSQ
jgi:hypothetical protein